MYIIDYNEKFFLSHKMESSAVAYIDSVGYLENNSLNIIESYKYLNDKTIVFSDFSNEVIISFEEINNGLYKVNRKWKNISQFKRSFQTVFEIKSCFKAENYLIPCVLYNGNEWGNGNEPKGLSYNSYAWIFSYDRTSIPSCTVVENEKYAIAIFSSCKDSKSLNSACSIENNIDGTYKQRIYHPVKESPVTYYTRDGYCDGFDDYIVLDQNEEFSVELFISVSCPRWKNFGIANVLDKIIDIFNMKTHPYKEPEILWKLGINFAKSIISDCDGLKAFIIGYLPDDKNGFEFRNDKCFELAWCGQNALFSRMLIYDYILNKNGGSLKTGIEILDNWVLNGTASSGLIIVQLKDAQNKENAFADTCNLGFGAFQILKAYQTLKDIKINKPIYLETVKNICDFFVNHYSNEYGFGKTWTLSGNCIDKGGTIGGFIICALCELYEQIHIKKYLDCAIEAINFYFNRDLNNFKCTAGALDTVCIDKETAVPLLISSIKLFGITKDIKYLEFAQKAAYYFMSWTFHYNAEYNRDSDFSKYCFKTIGMTSVSTQHHHLDMYGALVVPEFLKLSFLLNDGKWKIRAKILWNACTQCISDEDNLIVHDRKRPVGGQNEAYFHCRWTGTDKIDKADKIKRGSMNDWLVAWPSAFRLSALAEISDWDVLN